MYRYTRLNLVGSFLSSSVCMSGKTIRPMGVSWEAKGSISIASSLLSSSGGAGGTGMLIVPWISSKARPEGV